MKKIVFIITVTLLFLASCINQKQEGVVVADTATFEKNMKEQNAQLVDVRTPAEFSDGHLKEATNIDILQPNFKEKVSGLDKEKPVLVYCKMGGRSSKAASILKDMGFTTIVDLDGGFQAWESADKEVVK